MNTGEPPALPPSPFSYGGRTEGDSENGLSGRQNSPPPHQGVVVTLLFTDVVGSTALKAQLGDRAGVDLLQEHHRLVRHTFSQFPGAEEIVVAGDSFLILFATPSDAVKCALRLEVSLRRFNQGRAVPVEDRIGLHLGEVRIERTAPGQHDVHGIQVDTCARVMSLAQAGQILMTRPVFDNARQSLKGEEVEGVSPLEWLNHGRFELKGVEESVEICEVRPAGTAGLAPPTTSERARRVESAESEAVLGWRPAVGQTVPNTQWVLEQKLGEGGFGEVWLGRHQVMRERRVFKFCFRADRVRSLKREMTLFRLIKERIGDHPNIVSLRDVYFDEPPYYVEEEYVAGQDLRAWCEAQGGAEKVPLATRLELAAQIADALQVAHDAGVIHRDVKPGNILISGQSSVVSNQSPAVSGRKDLLHSQPLAKLTDFGIGQVISEEYLKGVTKAGFTQTMLGSTSSGTGTTMYLAPEIIGGKPATTRSDIYSLGVVLYQMLVGDFGRPVATDWAEEIADPLLRDDLRHCFAGRPEERFPAATQFATNLRAWEERKAEVSRRQADEAERDRLRQQAVRRHKLLLGSGAVGIVLVALAAALGYGMHQAQVEREHQRRLAYAADMSVAQQALAGNDLGRARRLLKAHRPRRGEPDLRGWEWRYLWQECRSDALSELCRSPDEVHKVAFSPDGMMLAVASEPTEVWHVSGRRRMVTLPTGSTLVAFSPRGDLLATAAGRRIDIWRAGTPNLVQRVAYPDRIQDLKFSPDGSLLASLDYYGELAMWDVGRRAIIRRVPGDQEAGHDYWGALDFSCEGTAIAFGHTAGKLWVVDLDTGRKRLELPAHPEAITAVAWSPKDAVIATGSGYVGGPIRLWDSASGTLLGTLVGHTSWISKLIFSTDGQRLYSSSADQTIRIWEVKQQRCLATLRGSVDEVKGLALSPDGATLASAGKDRVVTLWSAVPQSKAERPTLIETQREGRSVFAFNPDGRQLAVAREGVVHLYELPGLAETEAIRALGTNAEVLAYSPDGTLIVSGSKDGCLRLWSCAERRIVRELPSHQKAVRWLDFSLNGTRLLSADSQGEVISWDAHTWRRLCSFQTASRAIAVSPNGLFVLSGQLSQLSWWNTTSGKVLASRTGNWLNVLGASFSPDGAVATTGAGDGTVALWDIASFDQKTTFVGHMNAAGGVTFSPDGRRLATGGISLDAVKLWDLSTCREMLALPGRGRLGSQFHTLAFSRDGNWLAACNGAGQLNLWRAPSWAEIEAAEKVSREGSGR